MRITVVGTGYVGLVAGACFADSGNTVTCVDKDELKIEGLRQGIIPIHEPGLESLVQRGIQSQRLRFASSTREAVNGAEIVFFAVGTPSLSSGEPDLRYLKAAAEEVGQGLRGYAILVNKSTVPIGSHQLVAKWVSEHARHPFHVVSNPEFLKEGSAVEDFLRPDRIVIGTNEDQVFQKMNVLYGPFVRQGNPIIQMDPISAEMTKYACNSFLATRISFMNELAVLCDRMGGDIEVIRRGMMTDQRIGKHFLYAGVGYGGSCFPKDIQSLLATGREQGVPMGVVQATEVANERQKLYLVGKIKNHFGLDVNKPSALEPTLYGKVFAVWGLAFKPNTDDIREAPSLVMIRELLKLGAEVRCYDPVAMDHAKKVLGDQVTYVSSAYEAASGADALVLVTEWNEFRNPDLVDLKKRMKTPLIFDGRNIFDPQFMRQNGFIYHGIGRGKM